jgi:hypothetical protein
VLGDGERLSERKRRLLSSTVALSIPRVNTAAVESPKRAAPMPELAPEAVFLVGLNEMPAIRNF